MEIQFIIWCVSFSFRFWSQLPTSFYSSNRRRIGSHHRNGMLSQLKSANVPSFWLSSRLISPSLSTAHKPPRRAPPRPRPPQASRVLHLRLRVPLQVHRPQTQDQHPPRAQEMDILLAGLSRYFWRDMLSKLSPGVHILKVIEDSHLPRLPPTSLRLYGFPVFLSGA